MDIKTLDPRRLVRSIYRLWLLLGAIAVIVLPPARGVDPLLGALPLWLVVLPATSLALISRSIRGACAPSAAGTPP